MQIARFSLLVPLLVSLHAAPARADVIVSVENREQIKRVQETVEVPGDQLLKLMPVTDMRALRVVDQQTGAEVLAQAIDLSGEGDIDLLIFQSDFEPGQVRKYQISIGDRHYPSREQYKAYGRFVRERFDDFAWENDRIAHRVYGQALETWQREPLTSSPVDIWCKRVPRLVINDWYMVDNYHADHGEGADFYSAGKSRGVGGSGIWDDGQLLVSRNFMDSRVIANGPIRVVFELIYPPWVVKGRRVAETKRISLDAGQNLNRFESLYLLDGPRDLTIGVGIKKTAQAAVEVDPETRFLRTWEPISKTDGFVGCAVLPLPGQKAEKTEDSLNHLLLMKTAGGRPFMYYAGFGWDRSGLFKDAGEWDAYLRDFSKRLASPLKVTLALIQ